jgi:hypothetical protein
VYKGKPPSAVFRRRRKCFFDLRSNTTRLSLSNTAGGDCATTEINTVATIERCTLLRIRTARNFLLSVIAVLLCH